jgi:hypothetical protein
MIKYHKIEENNIIAEIEDEKFVIREAQDALDLMTSTDPPWCRNFIIHESNLSADFFKLGTGLAG